MSCLSIRDGFAQYGRMAKTLAIGYLRADHRQKREGHYDNRARDDMRVSGV